MSAAQRQAKPARPGNGGNVPPVEWQWQPGQSGNPGGFPKGFISLSRAYAIVATMEPSEVEQVAQGKKPKRWGKKPLLMPFVTAAKMWIAGTPPAASEIADRTEGKVKVVTETTVKAPDVASFFAELAKELGK